MNILPAVRQDAQRIAAIHKAEIGKGFLSTLPISFLEKFYMALIESPVSFCLVEKERGEVRGFISGVTDLDAFYAYFLKKYFWYSCYLLLGRVVNGSFLKKVWETLRYPAKENGLPKAELLTMAVTREAQGKGIAGAIFSQFVGDMRQRGVARMKVLVGEDLSGAIAFYEKKGFVFLKKTAVHGTSISRIYTYDIPG